MARSRRINQLQAQYGNGMATSYKTNEDCNMVHKDAAEEIVNNYISERACCSDKHIVCLGAEICVGGLNLLVMEYIQYIFSN